MKKFLLSILLLNILTGFGIAEENIPLQNVKIKNSYLTKAHIKTNSKTQIQNITIEKSFLIWVTVQKCKDIKIDTNTK